MYSLNPKDDVVARLHERIGRLIEFCLQRPVGPGRDDKYRSTLTTRNRKAGSRRLDSFRRVLLNELLEPGNYFFGVRLWHKANADFGRGFRGNNRLGAGSRKAAGDAMDLKRRPRPDPLEDGILALAGQPRRAYLILQKLLRAEGQALPALFLRGSRRLHVVIDARNPDHAGRAFGFGQQFDQPEHRVRRGSSVEAGVQVAHGAGGFQFHVDQPAQADAQGWHALGVQGGVGYQRDVRFELRGIFSDILRNGLAAHATLFAPAHKRKPRAVPGL